jgi:hypothetical protein
VVACRVRIEFRNRFFDSATPAARYYDDSGRAEPWPECHDLAPSDIERRSLVVSDRPNHDAEHIAMDPLQGQLPDATALFQHHDCLGQSGSQDIR